MITMNGESSARTHQEDASVASQSPALPLVLLLRQLASAIEDLNDHEYTTCPVGVMESSIGAHVRHCLDHVVALRGAVETGHLDYDDRKRGTAVESSRRAAMELIHSVDRQLCMLQAEDMHRSVLLAVTMVCGQESMLVRSTIGREIAYVASHTIHHNALIGAMVKTLGGRLPHRFGYAPSTVEHLERELLRCAPSA
jgi:uncharacterized damage-inducible protein DinB